MISPSNKPPRKPKPSHSDEADPDEREVDEIDPSVPLRIPNAGDGKTEEADLDDFDEEDFDDEFDDDFEEELDDEYDLLDAAVTEEDLAEDDEADLKSGGVFVDDDEDGESPGKEPAEPEE